MSDVIIKFAGDNKVIEINRYMKSVIIIQKKSSKERDRKISHQLKLLPNTKKRTLELVHRSVEYQAHWHFAVRMYTMRRIKMLYYAI